MKIQKIDSFSERVFQAVLRLLPQVAADANLPSQQYFEGMLASENVHFFIAELDDDRIAGMLTIGTYRTPSGIKVWIEDVVVDEDQRGKGLGKDLSLFAVDYARSLDAKEICLTSRPSRIAANALYQKIGFKQHETNVYKYPLQKN
jgi:ribosomal protein S18 acetylase RimI-like enzyme